MSLHILLFMMCIENDPVTSTSYSTREPTVPMSKSNKATANSFVNY